MFDDSSRSPWHWSVFVVLLSAMLIENAGWGVFQQLEEILLLPPDARTQTTAILIGWPFSILTAPDYTFNLRWAEPEVLISYRTTFALINLLLALLLPYTATKYLSYWSVTCGWRINIRCTFALVAVFATLVYQEKGFFWHQNGVGALSAALFRCIETAVWFCILATWYWLLSGIGLVLSRVSFFGISRKSNTNREGK